jgi:acyl carrier protein
MPNEKQIVGTIEGIILEELELPHGFGALGPDTPLFDGGLRLDSFGVVELISALETRFNIEFQEADFQEEHFQNIKTLSGLVAHYIQESSPS